MMKEAEEKKREARLQIAKLRRQFKMILEKNDSLPKNAQLEKVVSLPWYSCVKSGKPSMVFVC